MVGGVPYMTQPITLPSMPQGGGYGGSPAIQSIGRVFDLIEKKKAKRRVDKLLSSLGEDVPTQQQFIELSKYIGADFANSLMTYHQSKKQMDAQALAMNEQLFKQSVDFFGTINQALSNVPEEQRFQQLQEMVGPFLQQAQGPDGKIDPYVQNLVAMTKTAFRDGNFSDERITRNMGIASTLGQYQVIQDNKAKRRAQIEQTRIDAKSNLPKDAQMWEYAKSEAEKFGTSPVNLYQLWTGKTPEVDIGTGQRMDVTGRPFNLGTATDIPGQQNDPLFQNYGEDGQPLPGGVEDIMGIGTSGQRTAPMPGSASAGGVPPQPGTPAPPQQDAGMNVPGQITPQIIDNIIQVESGGDANAVSKKGARGLMQIMPMTAKKPGLGVPTIFEMADEMGIAYPNKSDKSVANLLKNPELNKAFGTKYLEALVKEFDGNMLRAFVAYNWGLSNARRWSGRANTLPKETLGYVTKLLQNMEN